MKLLMLDIDGCLNGHPLARLGPDAPVPTIDPEPVQHLNRIVRVTGCKIVLSSAWRYMILGGQLTLLGFKYLLRTHGAVGLDIIGHTASDEECPVCGVEIEECRRWGGWQNVANPLAQVCQQCGHKVTRSKQVQRWLLTQIAPMDVERYCVLDDDDYDFRKDGHPFVQCDGARGLTRRKADQVIQILGREL